MLIALWVVVAMLGFAVPALYFARLSLSSESSVSGSDGWRITPTLEQNATRSSALQLLLKMGWAWVLICAPVLAFFPGNRFNFKVFGIVLLGCISLGAFLTLFVSKQIKNFEEKDFKPRDDIDEMNEVQKGLLGQFLKNPAEMAKDYVEDCNGKIIRLTIFESFLMIPLYLLANWMSDFSIAVYGVVAGVIFLGESVLLFQVFRSLESGPPQGSVSSRGSQSSSSLDMRKIEIQVIADGLDMALPEYFNKPVPRSFTMKVARRIKEIMEKEGIPILKLQEGNVFGELATEALRQLTEEGEFD